VVRTALTPVVLVALLALTACGGGGGSPLPARPTVAGPFVDGSNGVWLFRPAGKPKRLVIFFHGQGGPTETTPSTHRDWIDHLVSRGAVVVYPRYETSFSAAVLTAADAGVRTASQKLGPEALPVVALGYSRGAALAVEYAAAAPGQHLPVPDAVESVNPVPFGDQSHVVDLSPIRPATIMALIVIEKDPHGSDGAGLLLTRLRQAGFPGGQVRLNIARSRGSFVADHLGPLSSSPGARAAYWAPTDALLAGLGRRR
jgi:acetyl esterase/lipase